MGVEVKVGLGVGVDVVVGVAIGVEMGGMGVKVGVSVGCPKNATRRFSASSWQAENVIIVANNKSNFL